MPAPTSLAFALSLVLAGCSAASGADEASTSDAGEGRAAAATGSAASADDGVDRDLTACEARWTSMTKEGRAYGVGPLEIDRERMLGRARGATTLFTRPPERSAPSDEAMGREHAWFDKQLPGTRITRAIGRNKTQKARVRELVLREGYLYAETPDDAYELEARVTLTDLFDEESIVLTRGTEEHVLTLQPGKYKEYLYADGPKKGRKATVVFGDRVRVATTAAEPALHRDILGLAWAHGLDRMTIERVTERGLLTTLRVGDASARAVIDSDGAALRLACVAEPKAKREAFTAALEAAKPRALADARLRDAVSQQTDEALPFDRPRFEQGPDKDGQLRQSWLGAYMRGATTFSAEGGSYPVFLADGRPQPPQVCADFVLESYERAAGSWFYPRGETPGRSKGHLDFADYEIKNRRGVLGLGQFFASRPDAFDHRAFVGKERIPFGQRNGFFKNIMENVDDFKPGDILAIHGLKRDDRVHQHAILLEFVDPITGFPAGLADQMRVPRRRSWEGIMAEAPKRSLLYRARPKAPIRSAVEAAAAETTTPPTRLASAP